MVMSEGNSNNDTVREVIAQKLKKTKAVDIHTHLFPPEHGNLLLSGADNLLSYHYLIEEYLRRVAMSPDEFWKHNITDRAKMIWDTLFLKNTPISESTSGIIEIMYNMGLLERKQQTLENLRNTLTDTPDRNYCHKILNKANLSHVVMTNDPFNPEEVAFWNTQIKPDKAFIPSIRLDQLFEQTVTVSRTLKQEGYKIPNDESNLKKTYEEFIEEWVRKLRPAYMAVSLDDSFNLRKGDYRTDLMKEIILPVSERNKLPISLMLGAKRRVNPKLLEAGDSVVRVETSWLGELARDNPDVKFLVTALSWQNQQELIVLSRKFSNIMVFGVWWFLNTESQMRVLSRMRVELLGNSFIPQHSDSRILEQVIYKWKRARTMLEDLLVERYSYIRRFGWEVSEDEIEEDIEKLLFRNFLDFIGRRVVT